MWSLIVLWWVSVPKVGVVRVMQFIYCGLRKFCYSKSSVYRWYPQLSRFVYDTYKTMEATRSRHGWVSAHVYCTSAHCNRTNFITSICVGLVVQVVSALLRGNWQDFNWHDASRGPSAIAELLVEIAVPVRQTVIPFLFLRTALNISSLAGTLGNSHRALN